MIALSGELVASLASAVVVLAGALLTYRQATKATRARETVDEKRIDAEAYKTAKAFYESMLAERKAEGDRLQRSIDHMSAQVDALRDQLNEAQRQLNERLIHERELVARIHELEHQLGLAAQENRRMAARLHEEGLE